MTVTQFITDYVRGQLSDAVEPYRWSNARILPYVNEGVREIVARHPEARYVSSIVTGAVTALAVGDELSVDSMYLLPLSYFVCARTLGEDSEDTVNMGLSNGLMKKFMEAM